MGRVGSIHCQIVPFLGLCLYLRSIFAPQMNSLSINYWVLICCTCHSQSGFPFFVYFGFLCLQVSSLSNFHPDTRGEGGHFVKLTCSIVLWKERVTANKDCWYMRGVLPVAGPHWGCQSPRWSPCCSGSSMFCKGTVPSGSCIFCTSQV